MSTNNSYSILKKKKVITTSKLEGPPPNWCDLHSVPEGPPPLRSRACDHLSAAKGPPHLRSRHVIDAWFPLEDLESSLLGLLRSRSEASKLAPSGVQKLVASAPFPSSAHLAWTNQLIGYPNHLTISLAKQTLMQSFQHANNLEIMHIHMLRVSIAKHDLVLVSVIFPS